MCDWLEPREEYLCTLGLHNQEVSDLITCMHEYSWEFFFVFQFENLKENIVEQHKKFKLVPLAHVEKRRHTQSNNVHILWMDALVFITNGANQ